MFEDSIALVWIVFTSIVHLLLMSHNSKIDLPYVVGIDTVSQFTTGNVDVILHFFVQFAHKRHIPAYLRHYVRICTSLVWKARGLLGGLCSMTVEWSCIRLIYQDLFLFNKQLKQLTYTDILIHSLTGTIFKIYDSISRIIWWIRVLFFLLEFFVKAPRW